MGTGHDVNVKVNPFGQVQAVVVVQRIAAGIGKRVDVLFGCGVEVRTGPDLTALHGCVRECPVHSDVRSHAVDEVSVAVGARGIARKKSATVAGIHNFRAEEVESFARHPGGVLEAGLRDGASDVDDAEVRSAEKGRGVGNVLKNIERRAVDDVHKAMPIGV